MLDDIVSYLVSSGLLIAIIFGLGYLFREALLTRLADGLRHRHTVALQERQHELDQKMGELKAKLDVAILAQDRSLTSILDISSERAKLVSKKELEAAEAVWAATTHADRLLPAAKTADLLNWEEIASATSHEKESLQKIGELFNQNIEPSVFAKFECSWARLYVSEKAWALFSAYTTIMTVGAVKMKSLALGANFVKQIDSKALHKAILEALPHQKPTIEKFPDVHGTLFLDEIKKALLAELKFSLIGHHSSEEDVRKARAIMHAISQA